MTFIGLNCGQVSCRDKIYTDTKSRWFPVSLAICSFSLVRKGCDPQGNEKKKKLISDWAQSSRQREGGATCDLLCWTEEGRDLKINTDKLLGK